MPYMPLYWVHTVSYLIWIASLIVSIILYVKINSSTGSTQLASIKTERKISTIGGHISVLGIFLSGGAMVSIKSGPQFGWFNFENYGWLATKQIAFFVILILAFAVTIPLSKKLKKAIAEQASDVEIYDAWRKVFMVTASVYGLVLLNTVLGFLRPF